MFGSIAEGARIKPRCEPLCSQPISDHGVGTVRPWAAVNLTIAQGRHNVSARDGGFPASRRTGAGAFLYALPRPLPLNAPPTTMPVHSFNHPYHRPADAVTHACVPVAGDLPLIHGPATAASPASLPRKTTPRYGNAFKKKRSKLQNEPNFRCKLLSINK